MARVTVAEIREMVRRVGPPPMQPETVADWAERLAAAGDPARLSDEAKLDLVGALERLKNAAAAAQARVSVTFEASQRADPQNQDVAAPVLGKSIGTQLALARRESPHRASRHLGLAKALVHEMPHTYAALTQGLITEWTATLLVQATACLSVSDRTEVDARVAPRLGTDSDRRLRRAAEAAAYDLDPAAWVARGRKAVTERRVSVRAAPDVMAVVSAFVPAAQGVACYKALDEHAKSVRAGGDTRSLDQIKADTFVARVTGQATAPSVPVEVGLVMSDTTLLGSTDHPARLEGYGPIPAALARDLLHPDTTDPGQEGRREAEAWVRRLFTDPDTGRVVSQDARRRRFTGHLRRLILSRDQTCRTPRCDAPVRQVDHIQRAADGGKTDQANGQGLCEACNYAYEAPGWRKETVRLADGTHTVKITTPTGHTHYSQPPPALDRLQRRPSDQPDNDRTELDDTG